MIKGSHAALCASATHPDALGPYLAFVLLLQPIANISRIMKKALPNNAKIAKDAKETVQECVSEFISFITSEASDKCQREKRKTINGDDLLWSMTTLGFEDYLEPLRAYLAKYREAEAAAAKAGQPPGAPGEPGKPGAAPAPAGGPSGHHAAPQMPGGYPGMHGAPGFPQAGAMGPPPFPAGVSSLPLPPGMKALPPSKEK